MGKLTLVTFLAEPHFKIRTDRIFWIFLLLLLFLVLLCTTSKHLIQHFLLLLSLLFFFLRRSASVFLPSELGWCVDPSRGDL